MSDLIKRYASGQVKAVIDKAESIKGVRHKVTKGTLRELFLADLLSPFLSSQFSVGSGIIINQRGEQSHQTDIIILNNHMLPPFIKEQSIGVYPSECVLATIEVKSRLTKSELEKAEEDARHLHNSICIAIPTVNPTGTTIPLIYQPLCAVFGFYGKGTELVSSEEAGRRWITERERHLNYICVAKEFSWTLMETEWKYAKGNQITCDETKQFIAVLIDKIRVIAKRNEDFNLGNPHYWLNNYIKD